MASDYPELSISNTQSEVQFQSPPADTETEQLHPLAREMIASLMRFGPPSSCPSLFLIFSRTKPKADYRSSSSSPLPHRQ
jgi:hypothetical protein